MFTTKIDNVEYKFTFQHQQFDKPKEFGLPTLIIGTTFCEFYDGKEWHIGRSVCSNLDLFDKERGRKIALTRALEAAKLPKVIRTSIWDRYFYRYMTNAEYNIEHSYTGGV